MLSGQPPRPLAGSKPLERLGGPAADLPEIRFLRPRYPQMESVALARRLIRHPLCRISPLDRGQPNTSSMSGPQTAGLTPRAKPDRLIRTLRTRARVISHRVSEGLTVLIAGTYLASAAARRCSLLDRTTDHKHPPPPPYSGLLTPLTQARCCPTIVQVLATEGDTPLAISHFLAKRYVAGRSDGVGAKIRRRLGATRFIGERA